jgi:hypothetical protein
MYVRSEDYKKIFNSLKKLTFNIGRPNIISGLLEEVLQPFSNYPLPKYYEPSLSYKE